LESAVARLFEDASRWAANRFTYGKRAGHGHRVWLSDEEKRKYVEKMKELEHKDKMRLWSTK
jgi:RNase P subunit RPR2